VIENNRPPAGEDGDLRATLAALDPPARDKLRRVLIHDQGDRDEIAMQLLRYRDSVGDGWANIVDMLTMYVEERRKVVRLLGEIGAQQGAKPAASSSSSPCRTTAVLTCRRTGRLVSPWSGVWWLRMATSEVGRGRLSVRHLSRR